MNEKQDEMHHFESDFDDSQLIMTVSDDRLGKQMNGKDTSKIIRR